MPERESRRREDAGFRYNSPAPSYGRSDFDCEMEERKRRPNVKKRGRSNSSDSFDVFQIPASEFLRPQTHGPWRKQSTPPRQTKKKLSQKEIKQAMSNVIEGEETESESNGT